MAKTNKKKTILYPVVFMLVVTIVFSFALASLNEFAKNRIAIQSKLKEQSKILYVFNIPFENNPENIIAQYNTHVLEKEYNGKIYFEYIIDNNTEGYAFIFEGAGLWGKIKALVALDKNFEHILGVDFISHSETPGLGGRIDEKWFLEQFRGIPVYDEAFPYLIFRPSLGGNTDAISGATSTSKAVLDIFNQSIEYLHKEVKGGLSVE